MSSKRMAWVALVVAVAVTAAYIFIFGVDWGFAARSGTMPSASVTCLILSAWASVPYLILLPIARREGQLLFTIIAVLVILAFGKFSMDRGHHMPGDEGLYIVVPIQQMGIAAVILFGWWGIRRIVALVLRT
jgi:hypothetical protein